KRPGSCEPGLLSSWDAELFGSRDRVGTLLLAGSDRSADTGAVFGVHLIEQLALALDDFGRHPAHRSGDIGEQTLLLALVKEVEQRARLAEIVITFAVVVPVGVARNLERRLLHIL